MPPLLTSAATVTCAHAGQVTLIPKQTKVLAGGSPVMCQGDVMGSPIAACALPPSPGTKPCTTVAMEIPGVSFAMNVLVGGKPAMVQTLQGMTDGVPPGTLIVINPGQTTVMT